jgi:hypothetical protein
MTAMIFLISSAMLVRDSRTKSVDLSINIEFVVTPLGPFLLRVWPGCTIQLPNDFGSCPEPADGWG